MVIVSLLVNQFSSQFIIFLVGPKNIDRTIVFCRLSRFFLVQTLIKKKRLDKKSCQISETGQFLRGSAKKKLRNSPDNWSAKVTKTWMSPYGVNEALEPTSLFSIFILFSQRKVAKCMNGGICTPFFRSYVCKCKADFIGPKCENSK